MNPDNSEIIIYQTEDGGTKIDVRMENETVWLTQLQMAELFQTTKQNISLHVNNAFKERELEVSATVKEYLTVQNEGEREVARSVKYYNLDVIIFVGYRVKSHRGTQFRRWALEVLREYFPIAFCLALTRNHYCAILHTCDRDSCLRLAKAFMPFLVAFCF